MSDRHEPTPMIGGDRYPRKMPKTYLGKPVERNVWFYCFRCPVCQRYREYPCNLWRGRKLAPVCEGRGGKKPLSMESWP